MADNQGSQHESLGGSSEVEIIQPAQEPVEGGKKRRDKAKHPRKKRVCAAQVPSDPGPSMRVRNEDNQAHSEEEDEEEVDELKYGARHVIMLIVPVSFCMAAVIITMNTIGYYSSQPTSVRLPYTPFVAETDSIFELLWKACGNALIFLLFVIVMTVLLILLYKFKFYRIIRGWLMVSSVILLSLFTLIYVEEILRSFNIPVDFISILLLIWNYTAMGLICIHWKGPLYLQQAVLVIISALMALTFIKYLPDWTVWSVLVMVSLWDLYAVLAPRGPLRILVQTAQKRNEPLFPALIYSSGVLYSFVAAGVGLTAYGAVETDAPSGDSGNVGSQAPQPAPSSVEGLAEAEISLAPSSSTLLSSQNGAREPKPVKRFAPARSANATAKDQGISNTAMVQDDSSVVEHVFVDRSSEDGENIPSTTNRHGRHHRRSPARGNGRRPNATAATEQESNWQPQEEHGVKLGLGDFIFYSVLVGKASSYGDWNTTIACYIGILIGLCFTLLLLAMFRKALPALPISISFGLIFYFCTRTLISPFCEELSVRQIVY